MYLKCIEGMLDACMDLTPQTYTPYFQIKACVPGEGMGFVGNYEIWKILQGTIVINWTPKELFLLICKRIHYFMQVTNRPVAPVVDWSDMQDVTDKVWVKFFPKTVANRLGHEEPSFFYICRHTHHYPREIISTVNHLLRHALRGDKKISHQSFSDLVHHICQRSVKEFIQRMEPLVPYISPVLNSFVNCENILSHWQVISFLRECKKTMSVHECNERDILSLLIRIGFLGVVTDYTHEGKRTYDCRFSYLTGLEVKYNSKTIFAVHPMFYEDYDINHDTKRYVYPSTYKNDELIYNEA
jgi:hypothetical protein